MTTTGGRLGGQGIFYVGMMRDWRDGHVLEYLEGFRTGFRSALCFLSGGQAVPFLHGGLWGLGAGIWCAHA